MNRLLQRCAIAAVAMMLSGLGWAAYTQPPSKPPAAGATESALPEITVEADRATLERSVVDFVHHVVRPMSSDDSLARWQEPVCPLVAGLPREPAEFVLKRISEIAEQVGAPVGDGDCKPNLYVIITPQPVAFLKAWRKRDMNLFGNAFPAVINRFLDSGRPVSVWYNDVPVSAIDPTPSTVTVTGGQQYQYQAYKSRGSRVEHDTVLSITSAIVIVDTARASGYEIHPIADYIAMVGLAEINLNADLGRAPSVLRLFGASKGTPAAGLSPWDQAFLRGLYQTDQASRLQPHAITESMIDSIAR